MFDKLSQDTVSYLRKLITNVIFLYQELPPNNKSISKQLILGDGIKLIECPKKISKQLIEGEIELIGCMSLDHIFKDFITLLEVAHSHNIPYKEVTKNMLDNISPALKEQIDQYTTALEIDIRIILKDILLALSIDHLTSEQRDKYGNIYDLSFENTLEFNCLIGSKMKVEINLASNLAFYLRLYTEITAPAGNIKINKTPGPYIQSISKYNRKKTLKYNRKKTLK